MRRALSFATMSAGLALFVFAFTIRADAFWAWLSLCILSSIIIVAGVNLWQAR